MNADQLHAAVVEPETVESLQDAYSRLFVPCAKAKEDDTETLAQPYPSRYVQSFTTDSSTWESSLRR